MGDVTQMSEAAGQPATPTALGSDRGPNWLSGGSTKEGVETGQRLREAEGVGWLGNVPSKCFFNRKLGF